jgi:steroid 5-alpha reductase family enzyme
MNWYTYLDGLTVMVLMAACTWLFSLYKRDVSIVDTAWSLMFLGAAIVYIASAEKIETITLVVFSLVAVWALRLAIHISWRSWGEPEDRRYQAIRAKYEPHFSIKSLFIIFLFQAVLAWIVSLPLFAALTSITTVSSNIITVALISVAILLVLTGLFFESVADWQLARFKRNPENKGKVMDQGLWKYSRHPNYFGECIIWWGFYLFALSSGGWWAIVSPLIMTWLLLKFSGVVMLEETIVERRPAYAEYIKRTNAFIPGSVKRSKDDDLIEEHA